MSKNCSNFVLQNISKLTNFVASCYLLLILSFWWSKKRELSTIEIWSVIDLQYEDTHYSQMRRTWEKAECPKSEAIFNISLVLYFSKLFLINHIMLHRASVSLAISSTFCFSCSYLTGRLPQIHIKTDFIIEKDIFLWIRDILTDYATNFSAIR